MMYLLRLVCLAVLFLLCTSCSREYVMAALEGVQRGINAPVTRTYCTNLRSGVYCTTRTY